MASQTTVIMQAYHWPSAEHLYMGSHADQWIFLDVSQLRRKSWMTRNRLRNAEHVFWFGPRVSHEGSRINLKDARVVGGEHYAKSLQASMVWYRANTPNGREIEQVVGDVLASWDGISLVQLNTLSTDAFFEWLGVSIETQCASMIAAFPSQSSEGLLALEAAQTVGAGSVLNPQAGIEFFDLDAYRKAGITLKSYTCATVRLGAMKQTAPGSGLSWLDTASWLSRQELRRELSGNSRIDLITQGDEV